MSDMEDCCYTCGWWSVDPATGFGWCDLHGVTTMAGHFCPDWEVPPYGAITE